MLADLPIFGYNVQVLLYSRKFFCNNERCHRKIFIERFTSELNAYGRRFSRTADLLAKIGLELGGNKGAVVSRLIGCPVSATTMLRVVKKLSYIVPDKTSGTIGVDDWAFKKGRNYGTIIVDLVSTKVVDLLADRDAETLAAWLEKHPEVHTVSRDQASAYALGIRKGAPQAVQVADRFHLLVNLRDAMQRVLQRQSNILKETFRLFNNQESTNTEKRQIKQREELQTSQKFPLSNKKASLFTGNVSAQRQFKFETAKDLYAKGYKIKTI